MDKIKQINTGVADVLAIKAPPHTTGWAIGNGVIYLSSVAVKLPPGNWEPLGIELTEEQCREVVDEFKHESYNGIYYKDYSEVRPFLATSLQSFASLMQANGCYSVNPYDKPSLEEFKSIPFCESGDCQAYRDELKQYQQAEANTGTWLILKRLS